jgi:recombinational DNA repair protein (RecF pathway)
VQERTSLLKQAESTKIEIVVPGRFDYTVGRKVFVKLHKIEPVSKNDKSTLDNMFSGNYIISAINHFISHKGHECTLELIKDSLLVNLDGKK